MSERREAGHVSADPGRGRRVAPASLSPEARHAIAAWTLAAIVVWVGIVLVLLDALDA